MAVTEVELATPLNAAVKAYNSIGQALRTCEQIPWSKLSLVHKVGLLLMVRLAQDVRCILLCVHRGYPVQASSMAACAFEAAYALAYVGGDESKAQAWADHTDERRSFRDVKTMVAGALKGLGLPQAECAELSDIQLGLYRRLCMAKHSNPVFQARHGYELVNDRPVFTTVPVVSEQTKATSIAALQGAVVAAFLALGSYINWHTRKAEQSSLMCLFRELVERSVSITHEARAMWPSGDPLSRER